MTILLVSIATIVIAWKSSAYQVSRADFRAAGIIFALVVVASVGMALLPWRTVDAADASRAVQVAALLLPVMVCLLPASAAYLVARVAAKMQVQKRAMRFGIALAAGLILNPVVLYVGLCSIVCGCS